MLSVTPINKVLFNVNVQVLSPFISVFANRKTSNLSTAHVTRDSSNPATLAITVQQ